jgi:hypothetical protein
MDDKFPPLDLPLRPDTWAYRMPQAFLGLAPTSWAMPRPPAPSSDVWNDRSLIVPFGPPPGRGILGQLTQLIDPPTNQTVWSSPTFLTPFLQPVSTTTAQLNSSSHQSSVPAGLPKPLGANPGFTSAPLESAYQSSADPSSNEVGARPFSRQRPAGCRSLDPTAGTIPNPCRPLHPRTFGRDCAKPCPIRIFAITRARDSRNFSTSWPPSYRFCLVPAPCNQCRTARRPEETLMPGTTAMRQFIWARASSIRASIGCLGENNWRFWVV